MNMKAKYLESLKRQEASEGQTENIRILRNVLAHVKYQSEWDAFVRVEHKRYGVLSYQAHSFYYVKDNMLDLLKGLKPPHETFVFDYEGYEIKATVKLKGDDLELVELDAGFSFDLNDRPHLMKCIEEKALEEAHKKYFGE